MISEHEFDAACPHCAAQAAPRPATHPILTPGVRADGLLSVALRSTFRPVAVEPHTELAAALERLSALDDQTPQKNLEFRSIAAQARR